MIGWSCGISIVALALAAVFEPALLVLHAFQAVIYVVVMILAGRGSPWGYGAGCIFAVFWNWTNLVHTTLITTSMSELRRTLQTGEVTQPEQLVAAIAATAHFVLIVACLLGYGRLEPKTRLDPLKFLAGGALAIGYFAGIVMLFGPRYVELLRRAFGL